MSRQRRKAHDPWGLARVRGPRAWARDHGLVARDSLRHVSGRLGTSLLVWLLIGIALALPGVLYLLQANLAVMTADWEGKPGLSVYFYKEATVTTARELERELHENPAVQRVTLVTPTDALEEFQRFAGLDDALASLDSNPLPLSLRVIAADDAAATELERLAATLEQASGVDDVSIEKTWLERLEAMTEAVGRLGAVLALLFAVGAVLVSATSVRLAIEARLDELRVMKLVGATDAYMRRPFLYFGLFYGLGGAVFGAMLISALLLILEPPLIRLLGSYGETLEVAGFTPIFFGGLLLLGAVLGVGGAVLAARQRLADLEVV